MDKIDYKDWINSLTENFPYHFPAPDDASGKPLFPIMGSGPKYEMNESTVISKKEYEEIGECGINICSIGTIGLTPPHSISTEESCLRLNINNASEANINVMLYNKYYIEAEKNATIDSLISKPPKKQCVACYSFYDEPTLDELEGKVIYRENEKHMNFIECYGYLEKQNPPFNIYINLLGYPDERVFPNNEEPKVPALLKWAQRKRYYLDYLDTFQTNFKPSFFSFDLYPIKEVDNLLFEGILNIATKNEEGTIYYDKDNLFYWLLETYCNLSITHNRPFWFYVDSMSFMNVTQLIDNFVVTDNNIGPTDPSKINPIALEQYLRLVIFSALAYGAKCIQYWTYSMRPNSSTEAYLSALLDRRNNRTASWHFAKKINEEIQQYRNVFLEANLKEVIKSNSHSFRLGTSTVTIESLDDKNLLMSSFDSGNVTYLMMVSTTPTEYTDVNLKVSNVLYTIEEITPLTSTGPTNIAFSTGTYTRILPPGGYRIIKCQPKTIHS